MKEESECDAGLTISVLLGAKAAVAIKPNPVLRIMIRFSTNPSTNE